MSIALSVPKILNWRYGGGKGFEYRTRVGQDELCHPVLNTDGTYSILSPNRDTWLSVELDGSLGERPSDTKPGPWESFIRSSINIFTELPKEGVTRDLVQLIILGDLEHIEIPVKPTNNLLNWIPNDKLFYSNGVAVRWKGFTAFKLLNLFEKGIDIRPFLAHYKGYNLARIFPNTDPKDWGSDAWEFPSNQATLDFLHFMQDEGMMVEISLCTGQKPEHVSLIKSLVNYLKPFKPSNLLLEAVNEPYVDYNGELYGKTDPNEFKNVLTNSGFPYCSGVYANLHKFYGQYFNDHSARDAEWFRKGGHNLHEAYNGGGPNHPSEPALRMPGIQDEPIRPDQCGYDHLGAYTYAATCSIMGAGATVHTQSGKLANTPTESERAWIAAFLSGLNVFPVDAILSGGYRRIVEDGQSDAARTYVVGNYSVRVKQNGTSHPETGWQSLDNHGICWQR